MYVDVGEEANLPEIASDLRRQGPHMLLVRCSGPDQRKELQSMLAAAGAEGTADQETRGNGGARRPEVPFRCDSQGPFLLAGRDGYVAEVMVQKLLNLPGVGQIAIAEFSLAVSIQQMGSIKVAVVSLTPGDLGQVDEATADNWNKVGDSLARMSVRFAVGHFSNRIDQFLVATRTALQVRACATVQFHAHAESQEACAMFILGPVGNVKGRLEGGGHSITRGDGEVSQRVARMIELLADVVYQDPYQGDAQDRSRNWPTIQMAKEKRAQHVAEHTKKIVIFFGSNACRRTKDKHERREHNRDQRAQKWYGKTGEQQHWRR